MTTQIRLATIQIAARLAPEAAIALGGKRRRHCEVAKQQQSAELSLLLLNMVSSPPLTDKPVDTMMSWNAQGTAAVRCSARTAQRLHMPVVQMEHSNATGRLRTMVA